MEKEERDFITELTLFFVMITGCRPKEAVHIMLHAGVDKTIKPIEDSGLMIRECWGKFSYVVQMGVGFTKTERLY